VNVPAANSQHGIHYRLQIRHGQNLLHKTGLPSIQGIREMWSYRRWKHCLFDGYCNRPPQVPRQLIDASGCRISRHRISTAHSCLQRMGRNKDRRRQPDSWRLAEQGFAKYTGTKHVPTPTMARYAKILERGFVELRLFIRRIDFNCYSGQ
jgi:hypothetical protein